MADAKSGAPMRMISNWTETRKTMGDVDAWMKANADNRAWNVCAIVKGGKHVYFKRFFSKECANGLINDHAKEMRCG